MDDGAHKPGNTNPNWTTEAGRSFLPYPAGLLEHDMLRLAALYNTTLDRPTAQPASPDTARSLRPSMCAVTECAGCGRTLISATAHEMRSGGYHCARCKPFPKEGRVDHTEWLARRRGA
jgi:hypothetical protein